MRKAALVVGINDYPNAPLRGCVNDATAFSHTIQTHENGLPNFQTKLAIDVPSRSKLMTLIAKLFKSECDTALFYFSGHGFLNELGGYIVTPDHQRYDEGISMDEILILANNSSAQNRIIILDCCFSGRMGAPAIHNGATNIQKGLTILSACKEDEVAIEIGGQGLFTGLLIDALKGEAADLRGHITPGSLYAYIDQALGPWEQRPVFKTNITQFTSLRKVEPQVPFHILKEITAYFPRPDYDYPLDPSYEETNEAIAIPQNVAIFKNLQKMEGVGLVVPVGEEHMYYAAQHSKSCCLTKAGRRYWRLVKDGRI